MEKSKLVPFVRNGLDILFVGLNPANGSDSHRHYFSVNQAFWNQLYKAGLITDKLDKSCADYEIFGKNEKNFNNWSYGITDLVPDVVNSNSRKVRPSNINCENLEILIRKNSPRVAVLLHSRVKKYFLAFLGVKSEDNEFGQIGRIIKNCSTMFYTVPFPHGNHVKSEIKINCYAEIKRFLEKVSTKGSIAVQ